jgi:DNA-binding NtrC family response regulator
MENKKIYRILIFDDLEEIRSLLYDLFNKRGYEVFSFPNPAVCPISHEKTCPCPTGLACSDFILSDFFDTLNKNC